MAAARLRASLVLAAACAAVVAGCGSSSGGHASSTPTTATVTHTVTRSRSTPTGTSAPSTTSSATPSTTTTQSSSTAAAAGGQCVASDLSLVSLGGSGATGHLLIGLGLRNTSGHACRTGGYPGVQFLGAGGAALATHPDHTTNDFFGETTLRELTLAPGGLASFRLGVTDVGSNDAGTGCEHVSAVQVIAPNDTATMRLTRQIEECGGTVSVSPLQAGAAALH